MSTPSPQSGKSHARSWIGLLLTLLAIGGVLGFAEHRARVDFLRAGPLLTKASQLQLDPARRHVVVLGTCLSGQHISKWTTEEGLGPDWELTNLGTAGSTPVEWYLTWKNFLAERDIEVLLLAYGRFDLTEPMNPAETEALDLATPADVDELATHVCASTECRLDLFLQRRSALYRFRSLMAGEIWHALGLQRDDAGEASAQRIMDGLPSLRKVTYDAADPAWIYLERMLGEARASGVHVVLLPLPLRPDHPDQARLRQRQDHAAAVADLVARTGVEILPLEQLPTDAFDDDVHLHKEAMEQFSRRVGEELAALAGS